MPFSGLPAQLNAALRPPKGDSTGELAGILYSNVNISPTLYIKEVKGYSPPYSIEKIYYRVDKKITS